MEETVRTLQTELQEPVKEIEDGILGETPGRGEIDISSHYVKSTELLGDYVSLDWQHIGDMMRIMENIGSYARDMKRRRPLNIILQAEPGSGKSHFIKCLAEKMSSCEVKAVVFNMTAMERMDDLAAALEAVRNLKVNDKLPLLFLDEFDSCERNYPPLLPLMWDGTLQVGHRHLEVGKVIIVLAGSQKNIVGAMEASKAMRKVTSDGASKLVDLLSRINGGTLAIPGLDEIVDGDRLGAAHRNRKVDKVCVSVSLLLRRFDGVEEVPWALLNFISRTTFRYGVRSISNLIDHIPLMSRGVQRLRVANLKALPLGNTEAIKVSDLAHHIISEDGPAAVEGLWRRLRAISKLVRIREKKEEPLSSVDSFVRFLWGKR
ncbi:MAG: hypothetical protein A2Y76_05360 [Planctomycetes bacterium RBG_13_60_9]|nr:MAG: hypothetical protein A2Y76_05360 [Planctomycetes bacterium RBG_13_60_9]